MRIVLAFVFLLVLPLAAHADSSFLDIQEVTSPGGIKAWLVEDHSVPVVSMKFGFKGAGAKLDPADKQGLSRMLSNTMDEGAGDLDSQEFQRHLLELSISISFSSDRDNFTGSLYTLTRNSEVAYELLGDALSVPRFDAEPVERMKRANQSRIRSALSNPDWIAARLMNDMAYEGHVYAQNSGGTLSSLESITPDDLRRLHKSSLGKNNLVVAVSGDITKEDLGTALDQIFSRLPEASLPEEPARIDIQNQGQTALYKKDIPQTIIEMIQPGIGRDDPDYQTAQVMNFILGSSGFGSRLTNEIREKRGLTYGVYSYIMDYEYTNGIGVSTSTKNESVSEILGILKQEWETMKTKPVSQQELETAKSYLIGSLPISLSSTNSIAGLLLSLQLDEMPIDYLDDREKKIKAVTPEDVQSIAMRLLDMNKMTTILVGQPEGITADKTIETLPNVE